MARRSPLNERYQKYTGPEGKTRKSAAAAKPKRASASGPSSSASKSSGSKASAARAAVVETPEYQAARKLWWWLLGAGLVSTAASWLLRQYVHATWATPVSAVFLALAYAMIFYALYIDWTRLRPQRKAAADRAKSGK
jgi:hypothetical protein